MKHTWRITAILLTLFFFTQLIGLAVVSTLQAEEVLPLALERPDWQPVQTLLALVILVTVATTITLFLIKFNLFGFWKAWFLISVFLTLAISFGAFIPAVIATPFAVGLALWKVFKPNVFVHNFTELFIYGGIAAIFVPILNVLTMLVILLLFSLYDYIAVRKTGHMVTLAKSTGEQKIFAGLLIPYKKNVAILGGGDMAFPLLFAGVVMNQFQLSLLNPLTYIIPICSLLMLAALFFYGEKKKFYPAIPYLTLGCVLGLGIVLLLL